MQRVLQVSVPRSRNHYLLKFLWDALSYGTISTCEYYTTENCCQLIPCKKSAEQLGVELRGESIAPQVFLQKSHDFLLSDLPPSLYGVLYQTRRPKGYLYAHLIWEIRQGRMFHPGSAIDFLVSQALYYARMQVKWSSLYADRLMVQPIYFEEIGSTARAKSVAKAIIDSLHISVTDDQLEWAASKSVDNAHGGGAYSASISENGNSFLENSFIESFVNQLSCVLTRWLRSEPTRDLASHLDAASASLHPASAILPCLGEVRISQQGETASLRLMLDPLGLGKSTVDTIRHPLIGGVGIDYGSEKGAPVNGSILLLPLVVNSKHPIKRVVVSLASCAAARRENSELWTTLQYTAYLFLGTELLGEFNEIGFIELVCDCVTAGEQTSSHGETLLSVGFKPKVDLESDQVNPRGFRYISEITVSIST